MEFSQISGQEPYSRFVSWAEAKFGMLSPRTATTLLLAAAAIFDGA